jgi:hypothetical protein
MAVILQMMLLSYSFIVASASTTFVSLDMWHNTLAHLSTNTILEMAKSQVIDRVRISDSHSNMFCGGCAFGMRHIATCFVEDAQLG